MRLASKAVSKAANLLLRFRYPVSLPEEIARALGINICNKLCFDKVLNLLTSDCKPTTVRRFMPRTLAESAFQGALRKEHFPQSSLFSFYFPAGWVEFDLRFDEHSRLRRVYVHHKLISLPNGCEMPLDCCESVAI